MFLLDGTIKQKKYFNENFETIKINKIVKFTCETEMHTNKNLSMDKKKIS